MGLEIWRMHQNNRITGNNHSICLAPESTQFALSNTRAVSHQCGNSVRKKILMNTLVHSNVGLKVDLENITLIRIPDSAILVLVEFLLLARWSWRNWGRGYALWDPILIQFFRYFSKHLSILYKHFQSSVDVFWVVDSLQWTLPELLFAQFLNGAVFPRWPETGSMQPLRPHIWFIVSKTSKHLRTCF